jgi:hypothetical protein
VQADHVHFEMGQSPADHPHHLGHRVDAQMAGQIWRLLYVHRSYTQACHKKKKKERKELTFKNNIQIDVAFVMRKWLARSGNC